MYEFECDCCHSKAQGKDINEAVLSILHKSQCDAELGAPWHPKCTHDPRFDEAP